MSDLKVCRICLRMNTKMYHYEFNKLKLYYEEVMALRLCEDDVLPQYFCYECATILLKFHKFKDKCYIGQKCLEDIVWQEPITYKAIQKVDRKKLLLLSPLSVMTPSDRFKIYVTKEGNNTNKVLKLNRMGNIEQQNNVNRIEHIEPQNKVKRMGNIEPQNKVKRMGNIEAQNKVKGMGNIEPQNKEKGIENIEPQTKVKGIYDIEQSDDSDEHSDDSGEHSDDSGEQSDATNVNNEELDFVIEEENTDFVIEEENTDFIIEEENNKIIDTFDFEPYSPSAIDADNEITIEMTLEDNKDQNHSAKNKRFDDAKKTLDSEICNKIILSKEDALKNFGVRAEDKKYDNSEDDEEEVNIYCERCDIRFVTLKGYKKHLIQSTLHSENENCDSDDENAKVLREKEKITRMLRKRTRNADNDSRKEREKISKYKKYPKIPSTCYQCSKSFESRSAYWRHHVAEHPGTSIYAPSEMCICEVCGVTINPGRIAYHMNKHTRETMYTCETCGKQFHAKQLLQRHQMKHTGEKPYVCSICGKRFLKKYNMQVHYHTIHLKVPFLSKRPRIRRKNQNEPETADLEDSNTQDYLDSELVNMEV